MGRLDEEMAWVTDHAKERGWELASEWLQSHYTSSKLNEAGYCTGRLDTGHEVFTCLQVGEHGEPHWDYVPEPCPSCFGLQQHAEKCTEWGQSNQYGNVTIRFTDDGEYWVSEYNPPPPDL